MIGHYVDRVSGSTGVMVGENPGQNTPASSYNSMIERGAKSTTWFKRVWRSMKEEFKKRHRLNAMYMPATKRFGAGGAAVRREDYRSNPDMVVPVADPNVTSTPQRLAQAQMLREASMQRAGYDPNEVEKNFLRALRIDGIEKFYPGPEKMPAPKDPRVQLEEMRLKGKAMQLAHDKQMFALDLMEQRSVNTAKIRQLTAQAMKLASEVGTAVAGLRLKAIDTAVAALQAHNDMISQKLEATEEGSEDDTMTMPTMTEICVRVMATRSPNSVTIRLLAIEGSGRHGRAALLRHLNHRDGRRSN